MNNAPLAGIAVAFIGGILAAGFTSIPFFIFWLAALHSILFGIVSFRSKTKIIIILYLTLFFLGGAALKSSENLPPSHISNFTPYKGTPVYIKGVIISDPTVKKRSTDLILKAETLTVNDRKIDVCGKVLVKIFGDREFYYGQRILAKGSLYKAPYFRISGGLNYRDHLKRKGIHSILSVGRQLPVRILERKRGNRFKAFALNAKKRMKRVITENLSPLSSGVLSAIILGERAGLSKDLRDIMARTGTVHIISISGLHVGIISFIIFMILKVFRMPRKLCCVITGLIVITYCVLTGARTPVIRVTIMTLILLFGHVINRQINIYNTLSLAALLILIFNPQQVFDVSFQLSFLSILSIVWLSPKITGKATLFSCSFAAWLGLLPLVAYYFNIISPIAILANIVVVPYLAFIIGSGLTLILAGVIAPYFVSIFSGTCEILILILVKFTYFVVRIPGAYVYIQRFPIYLIICYYIALIALYQKDPLKNS